MNERAFFAGYFHKLSSEDEKVKDLIPGGKAKGMDEDDLAEKHGVPESQIEKQLDMGKKVEKEHTPSVGKANEIAKDHVEEFKNYYSALKKMESGLKAEE